MDLKYSLRMLTKTPGVTAAAVLSLALGIGANATIFTWVRAVLLDPLPGVPASERVFVLGNAFWQRRFGGDPSVVGRSVTVNDHPYTIVGVMREDFIGTSLGVAAD